MSLINIIKFFNRPNGKHQLLFFLLFYVFPICTCTGRLTTNHLAYEYNYFGKKMSVHYKNNVICRKTTSFEDNNGTVIAMLCY